MDVLKGIMIDLLKAYFLVELNQPSIIFVKTGQFNFLGLALTILNPLLNFLPVYNQLLFANSITLAYLLCILVIFIKVTL